MFRLLIETRDVPAADVLAFVANRLLDVAALLFDGAEVGDIRIGVSPQARVGSYMLEEEDCAVMTGEGTTMTKCGHCGSSSGACPECGRAYPHGSGSHCTNPPCQAMNAPIDCRCGYVVSADGKGVLTFDMALIPWMAR